MWKRQCVHQGTPQLRIRSYLQSGLSKDELNPVKPGYPRFGRRFYKCCFQSGGAWWKLQDTGCWLPSLNLLYQITSIGWLRSHGNWFGTLLGSVGLRFEGQNCEWRGVKGLFLACRQLLNFMSSQARKRARELLGSRGADLIIPHQLI